MLYRVSKVIPAPVAIVDGQQVRYSDYLMKYRSAEHYLVEKEQIDINSQDGKSQLTYVRSQAMDDAVADAYASKLARNLDVTVTDADLEVFLKQQRQSSDGEVSEATYNAVISDYYGWSPGEYRDAMKSKLLRQKVAYAVDARAEDLSKSVETKVRADGSNLKKIADELNAQDAAAVEFVPAAWVPHNNQDGGLAEAASKLKKGEVSTAVKTTSGDGYYYVKLINSNETQIQYEYIHVPLKEFNAQLVQIEKDKKLTKFIKVEDVTSTEQ
jgi:hypothetical protein